MADHRADAAFRKSIHTRREPLVKPGSRPTAWAPGRFLAMLTGASTSSRAGKFSDQRPADLHLPGSDLRLRLCQSRPPRAPTPKSECWGRKRPISIDRACEEIKDGKLHDQFIVDIMQGGAGTSTNMNVNEVIANRGQELAGHPKGTYQHAPSERPRQSQPEHE